MEKIMKNEPSLTIKTYQATLSRITREVELFAYIINRAPSLEWIVPIISLKEGHVSRTTTYRDLSAINAFVDDRFQIDHYGQNDWLRNKTGLQSYRAFSGTKKSIIQQGHGVMPESW